ncbi:MAG TPA: 2-dehydropantoate 2-reductase [Acidimicrobiales bacterium]|nr:2-dehydropantoate 2-reductase [Acidimicrobiales bacterium]
MRFVIYGAGAIGGVIGGRLFQAGHDVTLIARGAHEQAIRDHGLTVASAAATDVLPVPVVGHPADAGLRPGDVVVLAMKSQGTVEAVRRLATCAPPDVRLACAQNGVENERVALRSFAAVYGVNVVCPATHLEPGVVLAHSTPVSGILDLGRYPSGVDATARDLAGALAAATFDSEARPDIMRWKYSKLLANLGNSIDAVCGGLNRDGAAGELWRRVRDEGEACLAAAGIDVASRGENRERRSDRITVQPVGGAPHKGSSTWQSLARATGDVETDFLAGEIVLLGRLHGVPTPANALLQRLAAKMAVAGRPPGDVPATEVLARLDGTPAGAQPA